TTCHHYVSTCSLLTHMLFHPRRSSYLSVCRVAGAGRGCRAPTQGRPGACRRQARHWGYSPMKPRVVHIIDRLPPDGAERLLCEVDRKRTRLNSSHVKLEDDLFCMKESY